MEPNQSLVSEVLCLLGAFKKTKNAWHLQELSKVLTEADDDLNRRPPACNDGLRKFVEDSDFTMSDADAVVTEVTIQWPEIEEVTVESVPGGRVLQISVNGRGIATNQMVSNLIATLRRTVPREWTPSISVGDNNILFAMILQKLKEARRAGEVFDRDLQKLCGDATIHDTPYDSFASMGESTDMDHLKVAFFGAVRHFLSAFRDMTTGLDSMIAEIIEVLDEM
ncbi:hypothetical protein VE02_05559 [Pseudogymnoascus sp. 03VT05]|nr:hypothetical protein VE02_05559 [Pseudogymnoascus sp. 03VT05]